MSLRPCPKCGGDTSAHDSIEAWLKDCQGSNVDKLTVISTGLVAQSVSQTQSSSPKFTGEGY